MNSIFLKCSTQNKTEGFLILKVQDWVKSEVIDSIKCFMLNLLLKLSNLVFYLKEAVDPLIIEPNLSSE